MNSTPKQVAEETLDLDLELKLDLDTPVSDRADVLRVDIAEADTGADNYVHNETEQSQGADATPKINLSPALTSALPKANGLDKLSVLVAHEDRTAVSELKGTLAELDLVLQLHRVTSPDDLQDSLQAQEWDIVCCIEGSSEFEPLSVMDSVTALGKQASAIFVHQEESTQRLAEIFTAGFSDSLAADAPLRIINTFVREAIAVRHKRQVNFHEDLLNEANQKTALLLDTSADAIAYVADGMIMHGNNALLSMLQAENIDELAWQSFIDFVSAQDQQEVKQLLRRFSKDTNSQASCNAHLVNTQDQEIKVALVLDKASHEGESCIQILLRQEESSSVAESESFATGDSNQENGNNSAVLQSAETTLQAQADSQSAAENSNGFSCIEELHKTVEKIELLSEIEPKGHILVMHASTDQLLDSFDALHPYSSAIDSLSEFVDKLSNELLVPGIRLTSSDWILVLPEKAGTDMVGYVTTKLEEISQAINLEKNTLISIGSAQYGVADIEPADALAKAFCACTEQKQRGGGFKQYAHRISDKGSSNTLMTAMELDRLSIRYQPIISLQNQPIHLYEASLYMKEDDGTEQSASSAMRSLGVEIENTQLDHWFFNRLLAALKEAYQQDREICISAPITASAIVNNNFFPDLMSTFERSGLPKSCMSFSSDVGFAEDYLEKTKKLYSLLRQAGFNTTLYGLDEDHVSLLNEIKPSFATLNLKMNDDDEQSDWQKNMKRIFEAARLSKTDCIVGDVTSAADLAKIWQCGAPFIRGSYLQEPMNSLDYEFSDIG